jgi:ribose 5-phosphate isomerase B
LNNRVIAGYFQPDLHFIRYIKNLNMSIEIKRSETEKDKMNASFSQVKEIINVLPRRIGVAADHGGFDLKEHLVKKLWDSGFEVIDFGNNKLMQDDDYPDFVVPLAVAVTRREVDRGIAVCGSGVGACVAINKVRDARACLINDTFSARQGVEDDNLNIICLGGRVVGYELAWELVSTFLDARFSMKERHLRRLAKVAEIDK